VAVTEQISDRGTGGGDGFWDDRPGGGGGDPWPPRQPRKVEQERNPPPEGYRIGMWLAIVSMSILFISLNVLYFYNHAGRKPIVMPKVLWVSTGLILLSSLTIELARRALRRRRESLFRYLMIVTLLLGIVFLGAQLMAWQSLQQSGFYVNRNFRSGYAYIFTALHGLHLIGGLWGLIYVLTRRTADWTMIRRRVSVDVTVFYWHFLDGLWLYLWLLIFVWK